MADGDPIQVTGKIVAVLPGTLFRVELQNGHQLLGHIAGKLRRKLSQLSVGDRVRLEMVPYDIQKGVIVARIRDPNEVRFVAPTQQPFHGRKH